MLRPYFDLYRDTLNPQAPAKICLHQHTHRPAAPFFWQLAARRPDPAFPSERDGPTPRTNRAFGNRAGSGTANRAEDVSLGDRPRADVVQKTVIRLTDDGIRRSHVFVTGKAE